MNYAARMIIVLFLIPAFGLSAGIVNRTSTRDTLAIPFMALDSIGNSVDMTTGDSVYITVFSPGGTVVFKDSMAFNDLSIKSYNWQDFTGGQHYAYVERVSVLDGASLSDGVFSYILAVDDNTGADLITTYTGQFQIVNSTFESALDSAGIAAVASSDALDSLGLVIDSLYAVLDSLQDGPSGVDVNVIAVTPSAAATIEDSIHAQAGDYKATGFSTHTPLDVWNSPFGTTFTAGSMGDSLNNPGYVQGSGGTGNDSTSIARWVWNTPQANHIQAGTFGKYLDTEVSGIGSGTGAFARTIVTFDSANAQPVGGVTLAVRNISQTGLIAIGSSDINGRETFNLDADSFLIIATAPGYLFTPFDSIVVSAAGTDTVLGYPFNPGAPSPGLCRVFGYLLTVGGNGEANAEVSAHLPKGVSRTGGSVVSPFRVSTLTDTAGFWAIDVVPSPLLDPVTTMYEFLITRSDGTILRKRVTVPNQSTWQLTW